MFLWSIFTAATAAQTLDFQSFPAGYESCEERSACALFVHWVNDDRFFVLGLNYPFKYACFMWKIKKKCIKSICKMSNINWWVHVFMLLCHAMCQLWYIKTLLSAIEACKETELFTWQAHRLFHWEALQQGKQWCNAQKGGIGHPLLLCLAGAEKTDREGTVLNLLPGRNWCSISHRGYLSHSYRSCQELSELHVWWHTRFCNVILLSYSVHSMKL